MSPGSHDHISFSPEEQSPHLLQTFLRQLEDSGLLGRFQVGLQSAVPHQDAGSDRGSVTVAAKEELTEANSRGHLHTAVVSSDPPPPAPPSMVLMGSARKIPVSDRSVNKQQQAAEAAHQELQLAKALAALALEC